MNGRALNEAQLLEEKAKLIVEKQALEEQSITYKNALKEFEMMKTRHTQLVEENSNLQAKVIIIVKSLLISRSQFWLFLVASSAKGKNGSG